MKKIGYWIAASLLLMMVVAHSPRLLGDLNVNPTYSESSNFWSGLYEPA